MATNPLQHAAQLLKAGEKGQASQVLRSLLREEPNNVDAWVLLSYTLDDREKAIKVMERAIGIDPSHERAQKRLQKLQSSVSAAPVAPVAPVTTNHSAASDDWFNSNPNASQSDDYWDKLQTGSEAKSKPRANGGGILALITANRFTMRIALVIVILLGFGAYQLFLGGTLEDVNGNTPRDIIFAFEEAYWQEDLGVMRDLICPGHEAYVREIWSQTYTYGDGVRPSDLAADMSRVTMEELRRNPNEATYGFGGTVTWVAYGETLTYNYDEAIIEQGGDVWIGHHVKRIDGEWLICDGPDTIYD